MAPDDKLKPIGNTGRRLAILSMDGGGVRGIIPAKILQKLEEHLKVAEEGEDKNAGESNKITHHLWEYFDIIAGTSSGGLITAMITTPNRNGSPRFNASKVLEFFKKDAIKIFPKTEKCCFPWLWEGIRSLRGSVYKAKPLADLLLQNFGDALLSEALTSVIIPAFDTKKQVPVFFSDLKDVDEAKLLYNAYVKDACRATTAVPILFPPAVVKEQVPADQRQPDRLEVFNVIDGGIAVNDPTLVAVIQAIMQERQAIAEDENEIANQRSRDCEDCGDVLVLSLGTGQHPMRLIANRHRNSLWWLLNRWGSPLLSSFVSANEYMVEYYTSRISDVHKRHPHYLRIQYDGLSESKFLGIDDAGEKNLNQLEEAAAELVESHREELSSFARLLVLERRLQESTVRPGEGKRKFGRTRRRSPLDENKEQAEALTDGAAPSTAGAVQTAVNGRCPRMRTAVRGCCSKMGAILGFVCFAVLIGCYRLLEF